MPTLLPDSNAPARRLTDSPPEPRRYSAVRRRAQFVAILAILVIYSYPALRTATNFSAADLPPEFAPDLSLYLNLSNLKTVSPGQVLNPYYLVPLPANGTAYLKFSLGADLFSGWSKLFDSMWSAMFLWNLFWWVLLCALALWLFESFLPVELPEIPIAGLGLLMLMNIGMLKPTLIAWMLLPHLSGFQSDALELPFMRAFTPQIPMPLLLAYLVLQMGALRKNSFYRWAGMGVLQLLALSAFPYATLMMAGLTLVSVLWMLAKNLRGTWHIPVIYGTACAIADGALVMHGSMTLYASHASLVHLQASLLPHLIGGTWLLLCTLTLATAFAGNLPPEVKWPLVGMGATNAALMLGDAVIPSTVLLLSHHASYFAHITAAVLLTFLATAVLTRIRAQSNKVRIMLRIALGFLTLNGIFLALGSYRSFLPLNRQQAGVVRLLRSWRPAEGDLFIARSLDVDDVCGWVALIAKAPSLFCTDAEVMLTPQQNREIHRFRQALYLYFVGKSSDYLRTLVTSANPERAMYQLGFWAEAISFSPEEKNEGLRGIQAELLPFLARVETHDSAATDFFHQFHRIILIDDLQNPAFDRGRLDFFLKLQEERHSDTWRLSYYVPK